MLVNSNSNNNPSVGDLAEAGLQQQQGRAEHQGQHHHNHQEGAAAAAQAGHRQEIIELSTNLREVSQCPEKVRNTAFSLLKMSTGTFTIKNLLYNTLNK